MPHVIDKTFEFCYGHRVWTQVLDGRFSADLKCACRHLHGHEGKVQVYLSAPALVNSMVTDFRHLEWLKAWLNTYIDHRFVLDIDDPMTPILTQGLPRVSVHVDGHFVGYELCVPDNVTPAEREVLEGYFLVPFVPTSERFSQWLAEMVQHKMASLGVRVTQVDWWETPKSRSSYRPEV